MEATSPKKLTAQPTLMTIFHNKTQTAQPIIMETALPQMSETDITANNDNIPQ